jgi:MFS family permease
MGAAIGIVPFDMAIVRAPAGGFQAHGPLVWGLALSQFVGWGTLYFAFSLFVNPMRGELGWSATQLNGALTLGLFVADLAAIPIGHWIDRHGGHAVMTVGAGLGALALIAWSLVQTLTAFYVLWAIIGVAQACSLINPAMTVLTANVRDYRRAMTYISFLTGLSSAAAWPLANVLINGFGWRQALLALAVLQMLVPTLANGIVLRGTKGGAKPLVSPDRPPPSKLRRLMRQRAFWAFTAAFSVYWFVGSGITVHLIPLLQERGIELETAVMAVALQGPAQVIGRMALFFFAHDLPTRQVGRLVFPLWALSLLSLLYLAPLGLAGLIGFVLLYGFSAGTLLIIRSTGVAEIFGAEGYGTVTGAIATVSVLPRTTAPLVFALLHNVFGGYDAVITLMFAIALVGAAAFYVAAGAPVDDG